MAGQHVKNPDKKIDRKSTTDQQQERTLIPAREHSDLDPPRVRTRGRAR